MSTRSKITREDIETSVNKVKNFKQDLDENVEKIKSLADVYSRKEINLNFIEEITRKIYTNPNNLAKIEFIQYIFFIVLLYFYNPFNINTKYPAFTNILIMIVAFMYVVLYFFIKMKVQAGEDVDLVGPTEKTVLFQFFSTIAFFVLFMLSVKGIIWLFMNTSLVKIFNHMMTILIVSGVLGVVYLFMKKTINNAKNAHGKSVLKLLLKIVMYLPCLLVDIIEYIKYEFNLTTKPVWILAGVEAGFIGLWFIVPYLFDKVMNLSGVKLLNDPVNLNIEHVIGNFNAMNNSDINIDQLYNNTKNSQAKQNIEQKAPDTMDNAIDLSNNLTDSNMPRNKYFAWMYNKFKHATWLKVSFNTHPQYTDYNHNRFAYKYSLSGWFYINPQPPNTNSSYSVYTNILNYGEKVSIEYNAKLNSLRVMAAVPSKNKDKYGNRSGINNDSPNLSDASAPSNAYQVKNAYMHSDKATKTNDNTSGPLYYDKTGYPTVNDTNSNNQSTDVSKYMRDRESNQNSFKQVYETNNVIYQKWNNIVINYEDGYVDVFLNGVLVGSIDDVVPYMSFDNIVAGANNGIMGGICNVNYYKDTLSEKNIRLNYKTLRSKNFPYI